MLQAPRCGRFLLCILCSLPLVGIPLLPLPPLAHAAAINVTTTADECDITGTACSPREAIQAANTDDSPLLVCESGYDGTWARRAGASLNRLARRVVCGGSFYSRLDYRFRVAVSLARPQS